MVAFDCEALAQWAERKRVRGHPANGRGDPSKCVCVGQQCLLARAAADHFRSLGQS
jgi:hypothetical protein